jgi:hypothetical protein
MSSCPFQVLLDRTTERIYAISAQKQALQFLHYWMTCSGSKLKMPKMVPLPRAPQIHRPHHRPPYRFHQPVDRRHEYDLPPNTWHMLQTNRCPHHQRIVGFEVIVVWMMKLEFGSTPIVVHLRVGLIGNVIRPDFYNSRFCSWTMNELPLLEN